MQLAIPFSTLFIHEKCAAKIAAHGLKVLKLIDADRYFPVFGGKYHF